MESGSESDAPEELTAGEGIKQHEEVKKAQRENLLMVAKKNKERRRQWAQKKTAAKSSKKKEEKKEETGEDNGEDELEAEDDDAPVIPGMLPKDIIDRLAAREKQTFSSDSEEEMVNKEAATKVKKNKKRRQANGPETIVLNEIPPPKCLDNSKEFLKKRRMQVARSDSILRNASHSLRLLSSKGGLLGKD
ncbi:hypothetical protein LUZ60_017145 [Juncus effusus]|nr:hypothetical protein LUZ60_017145 [Juncus effusus]